jgi:hypothetical protein
MALMLFASSAGNGYSLYGRLTLMIISSSTVSEIDPPNSSELIVAYERPSAGTIELHNPFGFDKLIQNEFSDLIKFAVFVHYPDKHIPSSSLVS